MSASWALGGSSSINGTIFQRGNPSDYQRWAAEAGMEQSGYAHFMAVNREGVKAAIEGDAANAELPPKERNQMILKNLGANWSALDDAAKAKWKDEAPEKETTVKKKKKKKSAGGTPKGAKKEANWTSAC